MAFPGVIKRSSFSKKKTARSGKHPSYIYGVSDAEGYAKGEAFWLHYKLNCDGDEVEYAEFFLNDTSNDRTDKLDRYLQENGIFINSPEDLVGLEEVLTLEKQTRDGRSYLNVTDREFVGWKDRDGA